MPLSAPKCLTGLALLLTLAPHLIIADDRPKIVRPTKALLGISHTQVPRDELDLNSTDYDTKVNTNKRLESIRSVLMRYSYGDCCPKWQELIKSQEVASEIRKVYGRSWTNKVVVGDLLIQLRSVFVNITYLSIEGQRGSSEWERYYNFYDSVQYYLRLMRVADDYLEGLNKTASGILDPSSKKEDEFKEDQKLARYVKSIHYKVEHDPTMSSFMAELFETPFSNRTSSSSPTTNATNHSVNNSTEQGLNSIATELNEEEKEEEIDKNFVHLNPKFEFYEDFIGSTRFGRSYASNISMIREYVVVFDRILDHVTKLKLSSNYTRPSLQYMMLKRMSYELFHMKHELNEKISPRIMQNRRDLRNVLQRLDRLVELRPEIKMLGDEFGEDDSGNIEPGFGTCVRQLTNLLDLYTTNNLTQLSFYEKLVQLPENFILLGAKIARDYETKEVPMYEHYENEFFGWHYATKDEVNLSNDFTGASSEQQNTNSQNSTSSPIDARNSNLSLLTRLFS